MRATTERRLAIRDFISMKRHTSIPELMQEFDVSKSTILRDLEALTETISYYTTTGNGGGIHATEGWYASNTYQASGAMINAGVSGQSMVSAIREAVQGLSGQGGDIVIPVYLGGTLLDEVIVNAQQSMNLRSGGR